tara:strand:- start:85 stop:372 length:288 start_codon:yes stop_codon:yes gene_type:complete
MGVLLAEKMLDAIEVGSEQHFLLCYPVRCLVAILLFSEGYTTQGTAMPPVFDDSIYARRMEDVPARQRNPLRAVGRKTGKAYRALVHNPLKEKCK